MKTTQHGKYPDMRMLRKLMVRSYDSWPVSTPAWMTSDTGVDPAILGSHGGAEMPNLHINYGLAVGLNRLQSMHALLQEQNHQQPKRLTPTCSACSDNRQRAVACIVVCQLPVRASTSSEQSAASCPA